MAATTNPIITITAIVVIICSSPTCTCLKVLPMANGILAIIPANMINEIPFPIPLSVICSPSHIMKAVPAVSVKTVISRKDQPGSITMRSPRGLLICSRPKLIPNPCMALSKTVPYLVYCVIFFLPSSPSFLSFSNWGITTVRS